MKSSQLPTEYAPSYAVYIQLLEDVNLMEELEISLHDFIKFVQNIPMDKFDYRYAEGKWTIKDHSASNRYRTNFSYRAMHL
jgi:hypothetical protein